MRTCLLSLLLIHTAYTAYVLNKTQSLASANYTALSMAYRPTIINGDTFDIALGLYNGTVLLTNTDNFHSQKTFEAFNDSSILSIEWTQFGILIVSTQSLKVFEAGTLKATLQLYFNETIERASVGFQGNGTGRIMTAVSFSNHIEVYEGINRVMDRPTRSACRALAIDHTGKYLYYFDNQIRFIVNILTRSDFSNMSISTSQIGLVAANAVNNEDITMSLDSTGCLNVWDDYLLLSSYPSVTSQTQIKLTDNSNYILTYSPINSVISVWYINYNNFTNWVRSQQITQAGNASYTLAMDAKNNKLVFLSGSSLVIYAQDTSGAGGLIILIIFCSFFCCCALCCVVQQKYGIRNVLNGSAWRIRQAQIDERSANYVGITENKNSILTTTSINSPPQSPFLYPQEQLSPQPYYPQPQQPYPPQPVQHQYPAQYPQQPYAPYHAAPQNQPYPQSLSIPYGNSQENTGHAYQTNPYPVHNTNESPYVPPNPNLPVNKNPYASPIPAKNPHYQ